MKLRGDLRLKIFVGLRRLRRSGLIDIGRYDYEDGRIRVPFPFCTLNTPYNPLKGTSRNEAYNA